MQTLEQIAQILTQAVEVSRVETKKAFSKEALLRRLRGYYRYCEQVTVRNGFPVLVWFDVNPADRDVGYMTEWVGDAEITTTNYGSIKFLGLSPKEQDDAIEEAFEKYQR